MRRRNLASCVMDTYTKFLSRLNVIVTTNSKHSALIWDPSAREGAQFLTLVQCISKTQFLHHWCQLPSPLIFILSIKDIRSNPSDTGGQIYQDLTQRSTAQLNNLLSCFKWRGQGCAIFTKMWCIPALAVCWCTCGCQAPTQTLFLHGARGPALQLRGNFLHKNNTQSHFPLSLCPTESSTLRKGEKR